MAKKPVKKTAAKKAPVKKVVAKATTKAPKSTKVLVAKEETQKVVPVLVETTGGNENEPPRSY